ncbi:MAG: hypothetical protein NTX72_01775 [Candidatus Uhrbacteria bacterium]|nr:hypothetical protein [Candidatus Uhrbacteria bacterium]
MKKISHLISVFVIASVLVLPQAAVLAATNSASFAVVYNGYGTVAQASGVVNLIPMAATQPSETHAALVVSKQSVHQPFQLSYTMKTTQQLRTGSTPNPWEVGWFLFGYKSTGAFKYLVMKPDGYGFELGESLLNNNQNFLYTSAFNQDLFPINTDYNVTVLARKNVVTVTVNGKKSLQYTLSSKDTLSLDGQYGFYTEDAAVQVSNIKMQQLMK